MESRRVIRENVIKIIYQDILGGDYNETDYSGEVNNAIKSVREVYEQIDEIITKNLENWTIDRLNYVDLAILRYATYEMKYLKLPANIAINEALEITKKYSNLDDDLAKKFNNLLLESIKGYLVNHG